MFDRPVTPGGFSLRFLSVTGSLLKTPAVKRGRHGRTGKTTTLFYVIAILGPFSLLAPISFPDAVAGADENSNRARTGDGRPTNVVGEPTVTIKIARDYGAREREAYKVVDQDSSNIAFRQRGVASKFYFEGKQLQYEGQLRVSTPKHVKIKLDVHNQLAFKLKIEGLGDLVARDNGNPMSLEAPVPSGIHAVRIIGVAMPKQWSDGRPADYALTEEAKQPDSETFRGRPIEYWVDRIRDGKVREIHDAGAESLAVWETAARDSKAATWVHSVFRDRDTPWAWRVWVAMLDSPNDGAPQFALKRLRELDPESLDQATLPIIRKTRQWLASGDRRTESAMEALKFQTGLRKELTRLAVDVWPTASSDRQMETVLCILSRQGTQGVSALIDLLIAKEGPSIDFTMKVPDCMKYVDAETVRALLEEVQSEDLERQIVASKLLAKVSRRAIDACDTEAISRAFEELMSRDQQALVRAGAVAFSTLEDRAIPRLLRLSERKDLGACITVCTQLQRMAPLSDEAINLLLEYLKDPDPSIRRNAIVVVDSTLCDSPPIVAALIELINDRSSCTQAIEALESIGPGAAIAIEPLHQFLQNERSTASLSAASAIRKISGDTETLLSVARSALLDRNSISALSVAADLLGSLGATARPALADLRPLLQHPNAAVRRSADSAIKNIEGRYIALGRAKARLGHNVADCNFRVQHGEEDDVIVAIGTSTVTGDVTVRRTLTVMDENFESLAMHDRLVIRSGNSSWMFSFTGLEAANIRRSGEYVAFMLECGPDDTNSPETIEEWQEEIPGFGEIADEIRRLRPGETKWVGRWQFTRMKR